jgi:hypothetical protein
MGMHTEQNFGRLPPSDMLYIHRKLGWLYLLLKRLNAKVSISELIRPYLSRRHNAIGSVQNGEEWIQMVTA